MNKLVKSAIWITTGALTYKALAHVHDLAEDNRRLRKKNNYLVDIIRREDVPLTKFDSIVLNDLTK